MNAGYSAWVAAATPTTTEGSREINSHTFIGLGLMATVLVVVWLIRRTRA